MTKYLTFEQISEIVITGRYVGFTLSYRLGEYGKPVPARKYLPPDATNKADVTPDMPEKMLKILSDTCELYKELPAIIFIVSFKEYNRDADFGPHEFVLSVKANQLQEQTPTNGLLGLNGFGINELTALIDIRSKASLNDYRELQLNQKEAELNRDIEEFERLKQNPAAANISKGVNMALTKFFNAMDPDDKTDLSGTETEATKAAEDLANDLIDSGMTASEIKAMHEVIKKNKTTETSEAK